MVFSRLVCICPYKPTQAESTDVNIPALFSCNATKTGGIRLNLLREEHEAVIIFGDEATARAAAAVTVGEFSLGGSYKCMITYMGSKQRPAGANDTTGGGGGGSGGGGQQAPKQGDAPTVGAGGTEGGTDYQWDPETGYYFHQASGTCIRHATLFHADSRLIHVWSSPLLQHQQVTTMIPTARVTGTQRRANGIGWMVPVSRLARMRHQDM
eukprot:COSAG06_NODE_2369_length_6995_cov_7.327001_7_plen_211_part_00